MDKQSIVRDAVSYVLDLQKKVQEIEAEIQALSSSNKPGHTQVVTSEMITPQTNANCGGDEEMCK